MRPVKEDIKFLGLKELWTSVLSVFTTSAESTRSRMPRTLSPNCRMHILCDACKAVFQKVTLIRDPAATLLPSTSHHKLHESLKSLEETVEQGCHFCSLILYSLSRFGMLPQTEPEYVSTPVYLTFRYTQGDGDKRVTWLDEKNKPPLLFEKPTIFLALYSGIEIWDTLKPGQRPANHLELPSSTSSGLIASVDKEKHPSTIPHAAQSYFETSSTEHMGLARDWLDQCTTRHPMCNRRNTSFKPTHLIYVGREDENDVLRLHLTKDDGERKSEINYCCLSHCWGGGVDIPRLTLATLSEFCARIELSRLPRTFQDAILITRQLGLQFIWIDSLCIIQDSMEDWAQESVVMGTIYQNSCCTIAAAEAQNSHQGCFVRRNPLACNPVRVAHLPEGELLISTPREKQFATMDGQLSGYSIWLSRLVSRGWVFQEALLSPKTLYFGRGLFWTCRCGQASELDPEGRGYVAQGSVYGRSDEAIFYRTSPAIAPQPNSVEDSLTYFRGQEAAGNTPGRYEFDNVRNILLSSPTAAPATIDFQFHRHWMSLLQVYTHLKLTMPKDRLAALAGIAQEIMPLVKSRYFAGLWGFSLPMDLLWEVYEDLRPRPGAYRAPSWSWASIDGRIWSGLIGMSAKGRKRMELLVKILSITTKCHPTDTSGTGDVLDGVLTVKGILVQNRAVRNIFGDYDLFAGDAEAGKLSSDTKSSDVPDTVFVLPVLRAPDTSGGTQILQVRGLGLIEKDGFFERVGLYSLTTPAEQSPNISLYKDFVRTIQIK